MGCIAWVPFHGLHCMGPIAWVAVHGLHCMGCIAWVALYGLHCMGCIAWVGIATSNCFIRLCDSAKSSNVGSSRSETRLKVREDLMLLQVFQEMIAQSMFNQFTCDTASIMFIICIKEHFCYLFTI